MVTLAELYAPFADDRFRLDAVPLPATELPPPYRQLLDHTHHMTVTVEQFYGSLVDVVVLDSVHSGQTYGRKITLKLQESPQAVVQYGAVTVDLDALDPATAGRIVEGKTPLGRVLIEHDVLRQVRPVQFFRVALPADLADALGVPAGSVTYGRLGEIAVGGRTAVKVCEVLTPVAEARRDG